MLSDVPIFLTKEQVHYLTNVLRLKNGDLFKVWNEASGEYLAKLNILSKKACAVELVECLRRPLTLPYLGLAQSIIKNDRMVQALDMATQIGVTEIFPIISKRSQSQKINSDRIERCLIEAAEQSERLCLPSLKKTISLEYFLESENLAKSFDMIIYANEQEGRNHTVANIKTIPDRVLVVIGPEGGFTDAELEILKACSNAVSVSLGSTILRSETAAIALLSQIQLLRNVEK